MDFLILRTIIKLSNGLRLEKHGEGRKINKTETSVLPLRMPSPNRINYSNLVRHRTHSSPANESKLRNYLNVFCVHVVRVDVHRRKISHFVEFENNFDGTSDHAWSVVSPSDPLVTCNENSLINGERKRVQKLKLFVTNGSEKLRKWKQRGELARNKKMAALAREKKKKIESNNSKKPSRGQNLIKKLISRLKRSSGNDLRSRFSLARHFLKSFYLFYFHLFFLFSFPFFFFLLFSFDCQWPFFSSLVLFCSTFFSHQLITVSYFFLLMIGSVFR